MEINWKSNIETARKQKDLFFGSGHPQSPIQDSDLSNFKGLHYFPPRYEFRFELELKENKNKTILNIPGVILLLLIYCNKPTKRQ